MEKLQFGDIETDAVCYVSSGLIAHRPRKDRSTEFSHEELKCIVKCVNSHDGLVKALQGFVGLIEEIASLKDKPEAMKQNWLNMVKTYKEAKQELEAAK